MESHFIVTVDGKATDIRGTSALAIRQGKLRKDASPESVVQIHYGEASTTTCHVDGKLHVSIVAHTSQQTHLATVHAKAPGDIA